jgi:hypothetical protein
MSCIEEDIVVILRIKEDFIVAQIANDYPDEFNIDQSS